jgi:hypothetical protein
MGFSIANSPKFTSIMGEITLAQGQGQEGEIEGLTTTQEWIDPELLKALCQQGCLRGETKLYTFTFVYEQSSSLSQLTTYLSDCNRLPEQKTLDPKNPLHSSNFQESQVRKKELQVLEPNQLNLEQKGKEEGRTFSKAHETAHRRLEKPFMRKESNQIRENSTNKLQQQSQVKWFEQRMMQQAILSREASPRQARDNRHNTTHNATEGRKHKPTTEKERETAHTQMQSLARTPERNEERPQQLQQQKREEEEGFADKEREHNQQQHDEGENRDEGGEKIDKIEKAVAQELASYGAEESILSEIFKMRVNQFDVLFLFIEILKLDIKGREQEILARREERELELLHMQKVVESFKSEAGSMMTNGLSAGILAIAAGILPIIGHVGGSWILQKLGSVIPKCQDMKPEKFFDGIAKAFSAMSDMNKSTSQVRHNFAESDRTFDKDMSEWRRSEWQEYTRKITDIEEAWKKIENFLYQLLQMYHDTIRQLYTHNA